MVSKGPASIKAVTRSKRTGKKKPIREVIDGPHIPLMDHTYHFHRFGASPLP